MKFKILFLFLILSLFAGAVFVYENEIKSSEEPKIALELASLNKLLEPNEILFDEMSVQSSDLNYFAFLTTTDLGMRNSKIWISDKYGENVELVVKGEEYRYVTNPIFSPNSKKIAYIKVYPNELWVFDIESKVSTLIYSEKENEKNNLLNPSYGVGGKTDLIWTDNENITFENYKPLKPELVSVNINDKTTKIISFIEEKKIEENEMEFFSQRDEKWEKEKLGDCGEETLGSAGCAVASVAMVFDYLGANLTPSTLNKQLQQNLNMGYLEGCDIRWNVALNLVKGITLKGVYFNEYNLERVDKELELGNYVIVGFNKVNFTNIPHWLVITRKEGDTYITADPWDGDEKPLTYFGSKFDHIIVYSK